MKKFENTPKVWIAASLLEQFEVAYNAGLWKQAFVVGKQANQAADEAIEERDRGYDFPLNLCD